MDDYIEWRTAEHPHKERRSDWYLSVGIVALALAVTAMLLGNVLFAIFILAAGFALALHATRRPEAVNIFIDSGGVRINDTLYPYSSLKSFWVEETAANPAGQPELLIRSEKLIMPLLVISIPKYVNSLYVRELLRLRLPEEELSEPLSQKVMEYLGF
ncbi:MAG: hypothetical protein HYT43_01455 [Candidatus Taylorbacteria bacterium]|nr:hypothetical protein [Candidatus Taylorbacteria bacterium]